MRVDIDFVYDLAAKGELLVHKYGARCVRIPGIIGGESGRGYRPMNLEWARGILEQCEAAGAACFVKQLGGYRKHDNVTEFPTNA